MNGYLHKLHLWFETYVIQKLINWHIQQVSGISFWKKQQFMRTARGYSFHPYSEKYYVTAHLILNKEQVIKINEILDETNSPKIGA